LVDVALGFGSNGQFEENHPSFLARAFYSLPPLRNAVLSATATNPLMTKKLLSTFVADPNVLIPDLLSVYQRPFVVKDSTNRLGEWLKVLSVDKDTRLAVSFPICRALAMTTLLIWGDKDSVTPIWQGEKLKQTIPNSTLKVLNGLGHIPQIEGPDQFNNSLLLFLDRVRRQ
jgi:pimeloyl-ACP methyl ester carboxylesterase